MIPKVQPNTTTPPAAVEKQRKSKFVAPSQSSPKCFIYGPANSGKTSLLDQYTEGAFGEKYQPTTEAIKTRVSKHDDYSLAVDIWDSPGRHDLIAIGAAFAINASIVMLVVDVTNLQENLANLQNIYSCLKEVVPKDCTFYLVGNKSDQIDSNDYQRVTERLKDFAISTMQVESDQIQRPEADENKKANIRIRLVSTKENDEVVRLFNEVIDTAHKKKSPVVKHREKEKDKSESKKICLKGIGSAIRRVQSKSLNGEYETLLKSLIDLKTILEKLHDNQIACNRSPAITVVSESVLTLVKSMFGEDGLKKPVELEGEELVTLIKNTNAFYNTLMTHFGYEHPFVGIGAAIVGSILLIIVAGLTGGLGLPLLGVSLGIALCASVTAATAISLVADVCVYKKENARNERNNEAQPLLIAGDKVINGIKELTPVLLK